MTEFAPLSERVLTQLSYGVLYRRLKRMCGPYEAACKRWRAERNQLSTLTDDALCELELIYITCMRKLSYTLCVIEDLQQHWVKGLPFDAARYSLEPRIDTNEEEE